MFLRQDLKEARSFTEAPWEYAKKRHRFYPGQIMEKRSPVVKKYRGGGENSVQMFFESGIMFVLREVLAVLDGSCTAEKTIRGEINRENCLHLCRRGRSGL